jgi:crotonobetainyl-CoA:carnitine CoA-transferase CaiB-like acyl-CoA transferase
VPVQPLKGLRVLDLTTNVSGPLVTMILARFGADVIKLERPPGGDPLRPPKPDPTALGTFIISWANSGKQSVVIDLTNPRGLEVFRRLVRQADVMIHNFKPGVVKRLGIAEEDVRELRPEILYCEVSAFGAGPVGSEMRGYDAIAQAFSGMMDMTGYDDNPARCAASVVDISNGLWTAVSILLALLSQRGDTPIRSVETALVDAAMTLIPWQASDAFLTGRKPSRQGAVGGRPPYDASDGQFISMHTSESSMARLIDTDVQAEGGDSQPAEPPGDGDELPARLLDHLRTKPAQYWVDRIQAQGMPASPVLGVNETVIHPLAAERGWFQEVAGVPLVRLPMLLNGMPVPAAAAAPELGEHTASVLASLGFDDSEIADLAHDGAVTIAPG